MTNLSRMKQLAGIVESVDPFHRDPDEMADALPDSDAHDMGAHADVEMPGVDTNHALFMGIKNIASQHRIRDIDAFLHDVQVLLAKSS